MPIDIRDVRVLVVGASGGIGGAVADAFAAPPARRLCARPVPRWSGVTRI